MKKRVIMINLFLLMLPCLLLLGIYFVPPELILFNKDKLVETIFLISAPSVAMFALYLFKKMKSSTLFAMLMGFDVAFICAYVPYNTPEVVWLRFGILAVVVSALTLISASIARLKVSNHG